MDSVIAERMSEELLGKAFDGWQLEQLLGHGKSALVFMGRKGSELAAVKIFDPDIVERFGKDTQLKRIQRELSLVGKSHPNLVSIYAGGEENGYLFVCMEYFEGSNLAKELLNVPPHNVRDIIRDVASAAKFLEEIQIAHRDIKPENIGIASDLKSVKLLDLGVIRPMDLSNVTDLGDQKLFIGTLQYSSPELLFREENPTVEGWRAVTLYQLGGVLHDLLTRVPLFQAYSNPYARLVMAVKEEVPVIDGQGLPQDLRLLAQNCLHKSPTYRLSTVTWEDFDKPEVQGALENARLAIRQRRAAHSQRKIPVDLDEMVAQQLFSLRTSMFNAAVHTCGREGLPRYRHFLQDSASTCCLTLQFEPSEDFGTVGWMSIVLIGAVVDAAANVHSISVWTLLSEVAPELPISIGSVQPSLSLQGVLIEKDVSDLVERGLLMSFASEAAAGPVASQTSWIDLGAAS